MDELVAAVGKTVGTFLQGLKDTGADPGELARLQWVDINYEGRTVNITPVKGHKPRILKISKKVPRTPEGVAQRPRRIHIRLCKLKKQFPKS